MLSIENHLLKGDRVTQRSTPNRGGPLVPQYLVMHDTAGSSARSAADWLCNPAAKASAHVVLGRDGEIIQLAPFNVVTWHAGVSHWAGLTGLNHFSIGIEMDNAGVLRHLGDRLRAADRARLRAGRAAGGARRAEGGAGPRGHRPRPPRWRRRPGRAGR